MAEQLVDTFGRVHRDLRISVTDRCNFRCTYCMPPEGLEWLPRSELLTFEEIERVARLLVERFGVHSIRLTGGEPTVRARLADLVAMLTPLGTDLALTTNGATLGLLAEDLAAAGLKRINISLDSLRADRFRDLTLRDDLDRVLDGVDAALAAGLDPVKVNVVVMRGQNDDEILDFAEYGRRKGVEVRFIEYMPLDAEEGWRADSVVALAEITERIGEVHPFEAHRQGSEPASRFRYLDGKGFFGVVASVTQSFCGSCDRIRLTADGQFRNCLFGLKEYDLRGPLRRGAGDDELADIVRGAVGEKWAGHSIGKVHFVRPARSMSQIGG
ncbi:MAG: GTP 3',8-cyclase MoaA [Acidimicrobiia bacterium]|nr:GTP 3',8-cyclase MoaA [Acidimicrobiia bacterium]MYC46321.1 GTP 3',8-cyclase MoaA [Acidimicrobiia bacterium]